MIPKAIAKAEKLRDTPSWGDVVDVFEVSAPARQCEECRTDMDVFINPLTLTVSHNCSTCREKRLKEREQIELDNIKDSLQKNIRGFLARRGVPPLFLDAKKEDFPVGWHPIIDSGRGLFLSAPRGVGKTHLAAVIVREGIFNLSPRKIRQNSQWEELMPYFVAVPELLLELRDSFNSDQITERSIIDKYSRVPLLVLDDLGAEKSSDWTVQTVYTIIDRRYREDLPTIITSNLTLDQVAAQLDDRIASRIAGMCKVQRMTGKDRRVR